MAKKPKAPAKRGGGRRFVVVYRHYRTGKLMDARKYGYKAWPLASTKSRAA